MSGLPKLSVSLGVAIGLLWLDSGCYVSAVFGVVDLVLPALAACFVSLFNIRILYYLVASLIRQLKRWWDKTGPADYATSKTALVQNIEFGVRSQDRYMP